MHCDVVHITTKRVVCLSLDCNGVLAIKAYGIKYEGSFLGEKSESGCFQNVFNFFCLHHFWA